VSRYSNIKIRRSNAFRAGRLGVLRRRTFNWCRRAITSPKALGRDVAQLLLAQADEVIE
jgi:hypothetical protein